MIKRSFTAETTAQDVEGEMGWVGMGMGLFVVGCREWLSLVLILQNGGIVVKKANLLEEG